MTLLIGDPEVAWVPLPDGGEPLVLLGPLLTLGGRGGVFVRAGIAARPERAASALPRDVGRAVVDGVRPPAGQLAIIAASTAALRADDPSLHDATLDRLACRHVAPLATAPHVAGAGAGAAVDLTPTEAGERVWMGSDVDATPEASDGRCHTGAPGADDVVCRRRESLTMASAGAGFVNSPTEWWHWGHGDRHRAVVTGAPHARYGPAEAPVGRAGTTA